MYAIRGMSKMNCVTVIQHVKRMVLISENGNRLHHVNLAALNNISSRNFCDKPPKLSPREAPNVVEGFQGKDHEFTPYRSRETVDRGAEFSSYNTEANLGSLDVGQGRHDEQVSKEGYGMESVDTQEQIRHDIYSRGEVSLDSVMQSNVPEPYSNPNAGNFGGYDNSMNMPGGGSGRNNKYLYSNIHNAHPSNKKEYSTSAVFSSISFRKNHYDFLQSWQLNNKNTSSTLKSDAQQSGLINGYQKVKEDKSQGENETGIIQRRLYSTSSEPPATEADQAGLSQRQRLKRAIKEYGVTVIVFHVGISLLSLGGCYLAVSSGLDVIGLLGKLGVAESIIQSKVAAGASTFLVAYALHKVFAPARIGITLTSTPFIVRHLRKIGWLKPPKVA